MRQNHATQQCCVLGKCDDWGEKEKRKKKKGKEQYYFPAKNERGSTVDNLHSLPVENV